MKFSSFFKTKKEINFINKFKKATIIIIIIPIISLIGISCFGINLGIDFIGGLEMQIKFCKKVDTAEIKEILKNLGFKKNQVQSFGNKKNNEMIIKIEQISSISSKNIENIKIAIKNNFNYVKNIKALNVHIDKNLGDSISFSMPIPKTLNKDNISTFNTAINKQQISLIKILNNKIGLRLRQTIQIADEDNNNINIGILRNKPLDGRIKYTAQFVSISDKINSALSNKFGEIKIRKTDFVDSQISKQLKIDGIFAVLYALLAILIYISIRFNILFSPGAIVALVQDTLGSIFLIFVIGRIDFDLPSIAALLTIVGYSINNTIVIYDRIREITPNNNKKILSNKKISNFINRAINETLSRTINTSTTTLIASISLVLLAGGAIRSFALVLSVGIILGAFSSIFTAPATYLFLHKYFSLSEKQKKLKTKILSREDKARGVI